MTSSRSTPNGTFETGHSFIRVLLPVHVGGGSPARVVFGTWLEVHPDVARRAWDVWGDAPGYAELAVEGLLANAVPPWSDSLLNRRCTALVQDPADLPVIVSSVDPLLTRVLTEEWPPEQILTALP